MPTTEQYDTIVIGAGQAGGPLSTTLARAGWKTALIEREHVDDLGWMKPRKCKNRHSGGFLVL